MEAAADLIVQAADHHRAQRAAHRFSGGIRGRIVPGGLTDIEEQFKVDRLRELGSVAEAASRTIENPE